MSLVANEHSVVHVLHVVAHNQHLFIFLGNLLTNFDGWNVQRRVSKGEATLIMKWGCVDWGKLWCAFCNIPFLFFVTRCAKVKSVEIWHVVFRLPWSLNAVAIVTTCARVFLLTCAVYLKQTCDFQKFDCSPALVAKNVLPQAITTSHRFCLRCSSCTNLTNSLIV